MREYVPLCVISWLGAVDMMQVASCEPEHRARLYASAKQLSHFSQFVCIVMVRATSLTPLDGQVHGIVDRHGVLLGSM